MRRVLLSFFSFLGSPALIQELRDEIDYLKARIVDLEKERGLLLDSALLKHGAVPLEALGQPPQAAQQLEVPYRNWLRDDMERELKELAELASLDSATYGPLLLDAQARYKEQFSA